MGDRPSEFVALQRLSRSFARVRAGHELSPERRDELMELTRGVGACALGLLERRLRTGNDPESLWAFELLLDMASDEDLAERAAECVSRAAGDTGASETARMMCLALLSQIDMEPEHADDPAPSVSIQRRSVQELARHLDDQADVARAADYLIEELEPEELLGLVETLCAVEGARAEPLVDELLCRDDVHEQVRSELGRLAAPIRERRASHRRRHEPVADAGAWLGHKPGASSVLICSVRIAGSRPIRVRAMCCALSGDRMVDAMYRDDFTRRGVEREITRPLERDGFQFRQLEAGEARALVAAAAHATHRAGLRLPRAYFLGRDIVGVFDEHITARRRAITSDHARQLLARAVDLMAGDEPTTARVLLERYRRSEPEDAAGAAALGLCLARLGELDDAVAQLRRAVALEPGAAEHAWNLAAVCHRAGDRAGCYLAMRELLCCAPSPGESGAERDRARLEVARYERQARLDFPGVSTTAVARAELHARQAGRLADAGSLTEAATELRRAVRANADHFPAWSRLGEIHAERGEARKARRCFERALAVRPDYQPAITALAELGPEPAARAAGARALPKRKRPARKQRGARVSPR